MLNMFSAGLFLQKMINASLGIHNLPNENIESQRVICEGYPGSRHGANAPFVDMIGTMSVRPSYGHSLEFELKMDEDG